MHEQMLVPKVLKNKYCMRMQNDHLTFEFHLDTSEFYEKKNIYKEKLKKKECMISVQKEGSFLCFVVL